MNERDGLRRGKSGYRGVTRWPVDDTNGRAERLTKVGTSDGESDGRRANRDHRGAPTGAIGKRKLFLLSRPCDCRGALGGFVGMSVVCSAA